MYCSNCGNHVEEENAVFCGECGARLFLQSSVPETANESEDVDLQNDSDGNVIKYIKNSLRLFPMHTRKAIIFALTVILLVLIILIIVFSGHKSTNDDITGNSVQSDTAGNTLENINTEQDGAAVYSLNSEINSEIGSVAQTESQKQADPSNEIHVSSVSYSMYQEPGNFGRQYTPNMAIDGDANTCWMASSEKDDGGSGNWIRFDFDGEKTVCGIKIINGNCWDGVFDGEQVYTDLYYKNGRVKDFELSFSDGSSLRYTANDIREISFANNVFVFPNEIRTTYVQIKVLSSYIGDKYPTVVCLSELRAFD